MAYIFQQPYGKRDGLDVRRRGNAQAKRYAAEARAAKTASARRRAARHMADARFNIERGTAEAARYGHKGARKAMRKQARKTAARKSTAGTRRRSTSSSSSSLRRTRSGRTRRSY